MTESARLAQENYERYVYARDNGHFEFLKKADRCDAFYQNRQWEDNVRARLERQGKPVVTINKVMATVTTVQGELINSRADVTFKPAEDGDQGTAHALSRTWLHVSHNNKMFWTEQDVADDGFITSRGFYDCRMEYDDNFLGHVVIKALNPRNVVIDPDASSYDPDDWGEVFITKWMSPEQIGETYGPQFERRLKGREFSDFMFGYDSITEVPTSFGYPAFRSQTGIPATADDKRRYIRVIERQYWRMRNTRIFVNPETGDTRAVPINWDEERVQTVARAYGLVVTRRRQKQVRWTVTADTVVLHDDWSPYRHFTVVPYFPYFRRGATMGLVENLIGIQEMLNKSASQELHIVNTTSNSGWKVKRGSLKNMTVEELEERGAETGLVVEWDGENPNVLEKIQPNQIPQGIDRITFKADNWLKEVAGVSDSMRGFDRADVSGRAIEQKQQRGSLNLAKPFDNLLRTRHLLVERVRDLVQTHYTEPRVLRITGERPTDEVEEIGINQLSPEGTIVNDLTIGKYDVVVASRPPRETYDEDQFQEAMRMREAGIMLPDYAIIELSHLEKKDEYVRELRGDSTEEEREARERQAQIEAATAEAEMEQKRAEAALSMARAQKVQGETDGSVPSEAEATRQLQLELKNLELDRRDALEREKMEREFEMKERELDLKEEFQAEELEIRRMQAAAAAAAARQQSQVQ